VGALWAVLAWLRGRVQRENTLVGRLVEQLESEVRLRAIPQGSSKLWRNVSILVSVVIGPSNNTQAGAPRITQSGKGAENHNVAHAHTRIRHAVDPHLSDTIQHQWTHGDSNINPGLMWWRFRTTWVPGFEDLLEKGITNQWYNTDDIVDKYVPMFISTNFQNLWDTDIRLVFRWLAIPWLQEEANS